MFVMRGAASTGGFLSPSLAKKAETPSIIAARLSSNPMLGWARAELNDAVVRGMCTGRTKALHDMTETSKSNMRAIIPIHRLCARCGIA